MADAAHAPSDLWHRSLEDLLEAIETAEAKSGSTVSFAITLQASTAPIAMPVHTFPRFEKLHVYQLQQLGRDNSTRFQLRLGIIESDLEADAILATVRKHYPSATKEVIGEEDRSAVARAVSTAQSKPPTKAVSNVSPMPRPASKDAVAPSSAKTDSGVEPLWNIDELLPNLANVSAVKRDRPARAGVTPRVRQPSRSGATQVRLSNAPIGRGGATKVPVAPIASPASTPRVQPATPVANPAEALSARAAGPSAAASVADSGMLLAAKIGTLTASPPATPVEQKAPPAAKPTEAVTVQPVKPSAAASAADSGILRSLAAKIGTLTASLPATPVVQKAPPVTTPAEAVTVRAPIGPSASTADSGTLRSLGVKVGTLAAPPPAPPVMQKASPVVPKLDEAVTVQVINTSVAPSVADTGTLQSLVAKIGTLVDAVETHAEATAAPRPSAMPVPAAVIGVTPAPATGITTPTEVLSPRVPVPVPAPASLASASTAVGSAPQSSRTQRAPSIDSTQTFRALTAVELSDAETSLWFVIQLMQSEELIDPEQVPKLDIFSEYRLYSVCEPDQGQLTHALRLGFFSSEIAAQAVAGYLGSHFPTINIKRVSIAERDRFAEQQVVAKKDVGEEGNHTVIEVSAPPALPPPVIASAPPPNETETPSFWSRLTRLRGA